MYPDLKIITNNVPRDLIEYHELTPEEQTQFDYIDPTTEYYYFFFRYKGELYDVGDCEVADFAYANHPFKDWSGYFSETFFSGVLFRFERHMESVVVGRYYT